MEFSFVRNLSAIEIIDFIWKCQEGSNSWGRNYTGIKKSVVKILELNATICTLSDQSMLIGLGISVDERKFRKELQTPIQCFCELAVLPSMRKQGFGKEIIQFMEKNNPTTNFLIHAADVKESSYSHFLFKSLQYSMQANGNRIRCIKSSLSMY
ncbi:hypothetical protein PN36_28845 [Candidatus Thiomargarita nelsonii]|uniref:N-acetyltransferase domain-containing protein n=1 Tax=Candidatus Thiomargarita nelsonii TaxID=1003181 RepID=A0A0A6P7M4_9GAMM|nr:hypothetical protein PN36_28845 [Candidatus Thiomargarita nelsonii]